VSIVKPPKLRTYRIICLTVIGLLLVPAANASQPETVSKEFRSLVPRQLLPLLHTPEIHQELKFSKAQVDELESLFAEIDGSWFQSRILPPEQQLPILDALVDRVHKWLDGHTTNEQQTRLSQIELQAAVA
jgi:hypothetical protein